VADSVGNSSNSQLATASLISSRGRDTLLRNMPVYRPKACAVYMHVHTLPLPKVMVMYCVSAAPHSEAMENQAITADSL
jgi:hypothetical protein